MSHAQLLQSRQCPILDTAKRPRTVSARTNRPVPAPTSRGDIEYSRNNAYVSAVLYYGGPYQTIRDRHAVGEASSTCDRAPARRHAVSRGRTASRASLNSVVRWAQADRRDERNGLRGRPIPGRPCGLSTTQQERLKAVLLRGACFARAFRGRSPSGRFC